ncbi:MAG: Lrp/AsnC family transcriptional regulator [Polyangiales bacterium]
MSRETTAPIELDDADRALLDGLQADCKQSLASLGERVGLSAPTVLERIRRLEKAGLIRGYHAVLDARAAGLDIGAFIGVGIDHPRSIAGFEKAIRAMPEVLEVHHVTGRHTLLVKIRTENTASLHRLIEALRELPGVARTETMVVLDTLVERQRIELPAPASDAPRRRKARPDAASTQEPRATRAHRPRE